MGNSTRSSGPGQVLAGQTFVIDGKTILIDAHFENFFPSPASDHDEVLEALVLASNMFMDAFVVLKRPNGEFVLIDGHR